ncbi:MAG TPA: filamentous hemagglutinin N-terminal domain-containing protein [Thioalkalivibrio sp.]|mgnify:FL=1|nr:filamentous hemagglutinin N-terminal domain-containing protein [Thioalkalivibrio sp.]
MDLAALRKSPLALAAAFCSAVTLHSGLAHADIVADGTTATTVDRIGGAEVVNIARPSAGGVSHNTFDRFSVGTEGAVINNSRVDGSSALAGALSANPNLADGTARIILNEVTSNRRSDLNGTTELFGDNARYILANPNGITCDGCGFIRTPTAVGDAGTRLQEVLLSTAVPGLDALDGATIRLTVDRNNTAQLVIGAGGLDASNVDITTLLTRQASVNGLVEALGGQLQLYAGAGEMTVADGAATTWQPDPAAGGRDVSVAIDASAAGAMHAGQIFILATDAGTGVSLPTDLLASGDIEITAAGGLVYRDARSQAGDVRIGTTAAGADLASDGLTQAAGDVVLAADGDVQAAQLRADGDVAATSRSGRLTAGAVTAGGAVDLAAQDDLAYGSAEARGGDVTVGTTDARAGIRTTGSTVAAGDVTWQISGEAAQITDGPGQLSAGGAINLHCAAGDGACRVVSQRDLTLAAGTLNTQADIETAAGRDLTIQADLDSGRRLDSGGDLRIAAAAGDIRSTGSLRAAGDLTLVTAAGAQLILDGSLVTGGELYLQGDGSYRHDATGTQQIGGQRHIDLYELINQDVLADLADGTLRVSRLDNQGLIENQGALRLQVDERFDNSGLIVSLEGAVDIGHRLPGEATGQIYNSGLITALDLTNNQLGQSGMILDPSDLVMAHTRAILDGRQRSAAELAREIQDANARLIAELNLDEAVTGVVGIQAERLTQTGTGRISGSDVDLEVGTLTNQGGQITAGRNLSITGEVLGNANAAPYYGVISAGRRLQATLGQRIDNSGLIEGGNVILDAPVINNTGGGWTPAAPAGGVIDTAGYLDALGGQAWFAQSGGDYRHILRLLYDNDLLVSDPTRLTRAFLDAGGIRLGPDAQLAGDDVYLAELLMHTLRAQGGMAFATGDRNGLGQLSTLYANTRAYMEATGLAFGQLPDSSQRAAVRAPVLVFAPQAQADGRTLYVPRLLLPEADGGLQQQAERLSAQIVAQENLFLKGETITNRDADLLAGDNLVIEAVDLNISGRQRDWYVDADGQVRYRTAQIAAGNDVVVQLSGRYVQDGAQVLAGN